MSKKSGKGLANPEVGMKCKVLLHRSAVTRKWYIAEAEIIAVDQAGKKADLLFASGGTLKRNISCFQPAPSGSSAPRRSASASVTGTADTARAGST